MLSAVGRFAWAWVVPVAVGLGTAGFVACSESGSGNPTGHGAAGQGGEGAHAGMGHGGSGGGDSMDVVLTVSAAVPVGAVNRLGGVQGGPKPSNAGDADLTAAYQTAGVTAVRLAQGDGFAGCDGTMGPRLTLGSIFPDRTADAGDPASYEFDDADAFLTAVVASGAEPIFQASFDVGCEGDAVTAGEESGAAPKDLVLWGSVVEHCLAHFNDGWANGHAFGVERVEMAAEPCALGGFDCTTDHSQVFSAFAALSGAVAHYDTTYGRSAKAIGPGLDAADAIATTAELAAALSASSVGLGGYSYRDVGTPAEVEANAAALAANLAAVGMGDVPLVASYGRAADEALPDAVASDAAAASAWLSSRQLAIQTRLQGVWKQAIVERGNRGFTFDTASPAAESAFFYETTDGIEPGTPKPAYFGWVILDDLVTTTPVHLGASYPASGPTLLAARSDDSSNVGLVVSHFCASDSSDCPPLPHYGITVYDLPAGASYRFERFVIDGDTTSFTAVESGNAVAGDDGTLSLSGAIDRWSVAYWKLTTP